MSNDKAEAIKINEVIEDREERKSMLRIVSFFDNDLRPEINKLRFIADLAIDSTQGATVEGLSEILGGVIMTFDEVYKEVYKLYYGKT